MGDVVKGQFVQKTDRVYACINCECQVFWLDAEGTITCKACKAKQLPPGDWVDKLVENCKEVVEE